MENLRPWDLKKFALVQSDHICWLAWDIPRIIMSTPIYSQKWPDGYSTKVTELGRREAGTQIVINGVSWHQQTQGLSLYLSFPPSSVWVHPNHPSGLVRSSPFQGQLEEASSQPLTPYSAKFLKGNHRFSAYWPGAGLKLPSGTWAVASANSSTKKSWGVSPNENSGAVVQRSRADAVRGQTADVPRNCQYQPSTLTLVYENVDGKIRFSECSETSCIYW